MFGINQKGRQSPPPQPLPLLPLHGRRPPGGESTSAASTSAAPHSANLTSRPSAFPSSAASATFTNVPLTPQNPRVAESGGSPASATTPNPPSRWDFLHQGAQTVSQLPRQGMELFHQGMKTVKDAKDTAMQMSFRDGMQAVWDDKKKIGQYALSGAGAGTTVGTVKDYASGSHVTPLSVAMNGVEGALTSGLARAGKTFYNGALPTQPRDAGDMV